MSTSNHNPNGAPYIPEGTRTGLPSDKTLGVTYWRVEGSLLELGALRPVLFFTGLLITFVALQSPIDRGGDLYLFSLHMVQHMLLMMVAPPLLLLGIVLFGIGFGNSTSLPPLIAQVEFVAEDVPRAVALIVAFAQGAYAFAPAVFGLIREFAPHSTGAAAGAAPALFLAAALVQALAIGAFLAGRRR